MPSSGREGCEPPSSSSGTSAATEENIWTNEEKQPNSIFAWQKHSSYLWPQRLLEQWQKDTASQIIFPPFEKKRMYLWWSSCTLYLHMRQVWLGSLLLCSCDVFWVLNNSLVCSSLLIQNFQHSLCFLPDYVSGGSCHPSQHVSPGWKLQLTNLTLCTPSCINYNSAFCTVFAKSRPLSCFPLLPTFQEFQNLIQHLSTLYTSHPLHPFTLTRSVMVSHDRQGWICLAI